MFSSVKWKTYAASNTIHNPHSSTEDTAGGSRSASGYDVTDDYDVTQYGRTMQTFSLSINAMNYYVN